MDTMLFLVFFIYYLIIVNTTQEYNILSHWKPPKKSSYYFRASNSRPRSVYFRTLVWHGRTHRKKCYAYIHTPMTMVGATLRFVLKWLQPIIAFISLHRVENLVFQCIDSPLHASRCIMWTGFKLPSSRRVVANKGHLASCVPPGLLCDSLLRTRLTTGSTRPLLLMKVLGA